jgi:hypothetical protein
MAEISRAIYCAVKVCGSPTFSSYVRSNIFSLFATATRVSDIWTAPVAGCNAQLADQTNGTGELFPLAYNHRTPELGRLRDETMSIHWPACGVCSNSSSGSPSVRRSARLSCAGSGEMGM